MTSDVRRHTDDEDSNYAAERGNGLEAGYGRAKVAASGPLAIIGLIAIIAVAALIYVSWSGVKELKTELVATRVAISESNRGHELMACVISMTIDERHASRTARSRNDFQTWCPWLQR